MFGVHPRSTLAKVSEQVYKRLVRNKIPKNGPAVWNDVRMPSQFVSESRAFDEFLPTSWHNNQPNVEGGEVTCHENYTVGGDQVTIIGGGRGVSTVRAARNVGTGGQVRVYEASAKYVDLINKVIDMNNVTSQVTVNHALVGPGVDVYGDQKKEHVPRISPQELPECDVLEMDCEGAEFTIIEYLTISPRVMIIEIHPRKAKVTNASEILFDRLSSLNYGIVDRRTNTGEKLTQSQLVDELHANERGEAMAPVVAFGRETT